MPAFCIFTKTSFMFKTIWCEIITIGEELLIGQVIDTNSAWIGKELNALGIKIRRITSITDNQDEIIRALDAADNYADIILVTGGLGPTKDDVTKNALCVYFKTHLIRNEKALANVNRLFSIRNREVTELNQKQADVPANCIVLQNPRGTAPGMWIEEQGKIYVSMPGVPGEMKGIMESEVLPRIQNKFNLPPVLHRTYMTQGIGESFLSEMIAEWEDQLPPTIRLAYLPSAGVVRLRLSAIGADEKTLSRELDKQEEKLFEVAGEYIYGKGEVRLEKIIGDLFRERKLSLSTAESCTGGYVAHRITTVPGSSDYYTGSVICYADRIKSEQLAVPPDLIKEKGAVSEEVVRLMAEGVKKLYATDYALATSGIAGPGGATAVKPVGLVWIAVAGPNGTHTKQLRLGDVRERVIHETANHILRMLQKIVTGSGQLH